MVYRVVISLFLINILYPDISWADSNDQFLLPKMGSMSVDLNDADALTSFGVLYGYGITPKLTLEAELNMGLSGGGYNRTLNTGTRLQGEYTVWTIAGYGAYRVSITGNVYFKGKLGLLYENVERDGIQTTGGGLVQSDDKKSTGLGVAGGLGFGFLVHSTIYEIEVTVIDEDIVFYSLGVNYVF